MASLPTSSTAPILTISAVADLIKDTLEDNFAQVWLCGEISNLSVPNSGHWYFTLKDNYSQLRCAIFRINNRRVAFQPDNGQQVICHGRISLYSQRGDVQFIGDSMEVEGLGGLQLAYEQLKKALELEGLFAQSHKRLLPQHPVTIGVVTSATGAAIHDIMNVLHRRAAGVRIIVYPTLVQGAQAPAKIVQAIEELNSHGQAEVLIVGRGGGSLEDLQAFNSEIVARAIYASTIPVISAVGHETDYTIADFVADQRAPTPSAAAELVVKNSQELELHIDQLKIRLHNAIKHNMQRAAEQYNNLVVRLRSPAQQLHINQQRLVTSNQRLWLAFERLCSNRQEKLCHQSDQLNALSPLHTIARGFVAVSLTNEPTQLLKNAQPLQPGTMINLRFSDAQVQAKVVQINPLPAVKPEQS
jgi:exodeoxyribonuclease VII large subunit